MNRKKTITAISAAVMTGILLTGCGTPGAAPSADGAAPEPQPCAFFVKDMAAGEWVPIGDETNSTAGERLYVEAAAQAVTQDLMEQYDYTQEEAETLMAEGGLEVYLRLDRQLQELAETACAEEENRPASESGEPMQSSVVLLDSATGNVLAIAGDPQAPHMPGSALAPLSVYAPALEKGAVTPESTVQDQPLFPEKKWPVNPYGTYRGTITVSEALSVNSSCVPVWILDQYLTPEESAQFVQDHFGIELVSERTVDGRSVTDLTPAGLALGGLTDGISTMDMAVAYSVFARGGEYVKPTLYTLVTRNGGEALLERNTPQTTRVIKEETAAAMTALLKETVTDSAGRMAGFAGQEVAGVPGISASRKDFWFVGYTPEYTAAIWSGYASHEQVTLPQNPSVRLWRQMMEGVFDKL